MNIVQYKVYTLSLGFYPLAAISPRLSDFSSAGPVDKELGYHPGIETGIRRYKAGVKD